LLENFLSHLGDKVGDGGGGGEGVHQPPPETHTYNSPPYACAILNEECKDDFASVSYFLHVPPSFFVFIRETTELFTSVTVAFRHVSLKKTKNKLFVFFREFLSFFVENTR
jgi:hypothetical protein